MKGSGLAEAVLPRYRSGTDVWRWDAANARGAEMHAATADLRAMRSTEDPVELLDVVQRAIKAAITTLLKADDSSGVIGDAVLDLLDLHVTVAEAANPSPAKLVRWLIAFQFDGRQDFFEIDPVRYAPVLGDRGMALYRSRLAEIEAALPPEPAAGDAYDPMRMITGGEAWEREADARHARFLLQYNERRLAVLDRDVDAIIATHARDGRVAAWLQDAAEALEEIGRFDLAIDWADKATHHDLGFQAQKAADYWCALLGEHRPDALAAARLDVFRRWPTAERGTRLQAATVDWQAVEPEVHAALRTVPREAVLFALTTDPVEALALFDELGVRDRDVTERLATALERVDVAQALALHRDLAESDLVKTDTRIYRPVAKRLARMRRLASGTSLSAQVDAFITELRSRYPRRSRMQAEFDRARLP